MSLLMVGCVSTVAGVAVRATSPEPAGDVRPLTESALEGLLLSDRDIDTIVGTSMEVFESGDKLVDLAELVSDPDCVSAVFAAEERVYTGTGWTAARVGLYTGAEFEDDTAIVAQAVILFRAAQQATAILDSAREQWRDCARPSADITVDDHRWIPSDVREVSDVLIVQDSEHVGYTRCQHALGVVANLAVEALSCDSTANDHAEEIATRIMATAQR